MIDAKGIRKASTGERFWAQMIVALLCVGLSSVAAAPFFFIGRAETEIGRLELRMPITHDMHLHYEQMKSFHTGLTAGEIYPRWEEDTNRGFGAPTTSYYPPGIYYLTSAFFAISGNWLRALLCTHLLVMIASATAMYYYARQTLSSAAASAAMIAYIFLPYHIVDQYQRGAIAELLGFIWMPLMLAFGERLFKSGAGELPNPFTRQSFSTTLRDVAGLAASYGAFLWSHPPTAYQFTLAFGVYALALTVMRRDWKGLLLTGGAMVIGFGLSAAYLYPAAVEQDQIRHEYVSDTWPYHSTYVFLHDLPFSGGHRGFFNLIDSIWIFSAVAIAITALYLALRWRTIALSPGSKQRLVLWLIIGALACFMMTKASYPLGRLIPKIDIGVFTWRMLSITTLVVALVAGAAAQATMSAFKRGRRLQVALSSFFALLITLGGTALSVVAVAGPMLYAPVFVPSIEHINLAMIPRTAPEDPLELPDVDRAELAAGNGQVTVDRWDPEHRSLSVDLAAPDMLLVRTFYFPGWTARLDGQRIEIGKGQALRIELNEEEEALIREIDLPEWTSELDGEPVKVIGRETLGDIVLDLPAGSHLITLDFVNTPARRAGGIVTVISILVVMGIALAPVAARLRKMGAGSQVSGAGVDVGGRMTRVGAEEGD